MHMLSSHNHLHFQAHAVFHLLRLGKPIRMFPVSVFTQQVLSINTSVLSISCVQNNCKPSLHECVTLLNATDRQTHKKPDITSKL